MRRLFSDLSQLACDSVFIRGAAVVFLCAAELFVRRNAAGVFFRRAVECSFIELRRVRSSSCCRTFVELLSDFRRAAESSFAELLSDFRRAAVGSVLSSSCCRSVLWSSCCSEQETVERMSLLSDAGVNNRAKKPWKRCRKQSRELFPEVRWPRPFTERVAFR